MAGVLCETVVVIALSFNAMCRNRRFLKLIGFVCLWIPLVSLAQSNTWSIKRFEIAKERAAKCEYSGISYNCTDTNKYVSDEQEQAILGWLGEVAEFFESQGFREPHYDAKTSDGQAYEVYV